MFTAVAAAAAVAVVLAPVALCLPSLCDSGSDRGEAIEEEELLLGADWFAFGSVSSPPPWPLLTPRFSCALRSDFPLSTNPDLPGSEISSSEPSVSFLSV